MAEDLRQLILQEIGKQWEKTEDDYQDDEDLNCNIITNALMFLKPECEEDSSWKVIREVLRQSDDFQSFNFRYSGHLIFDSVLERFCSRHIESIYDFLLEKGLSRYFKLDALDFLGQYGRMHKDMLPKMEGLTANLLERYAEDLPKHTICDGEVAAQAVEIVVICGFNHLIPQVKSIFATDLVAEDVVGSLDEVLQKIKKGVQTNDNVIGYDPKEIIAISSKVKDTLNVPYFRQGDAVQKYTLRLTLKGLTPAIYRKFIVPSNIILHHLASLMIELMGWDATHT